TPFIVASRGRGPSAAHACRIKRHCCRSQAFRQRARDDAPAARRRTGASHTARPGHGASRHPGTPRRPPVGTAARHTLPFPAKRRFRRDTGGTGRGPGGGAGTAEPRAPRGAGAGMPVPAPAVRGANKTPAPPYGEFSETSTRSEPIRLCQNPDPTRSRSLGYPSLSACIRDLERHGHLIRIREEVDPYLEMAAIHRRVYAAGGPALLFENVKGSRFPAVSNLFGTLERARFMFRDTFEAVQALTRLKYDPMAAAKHPFRHLPALRTALYALPKRRRRGAPILHGRTRISELPQIVSWPQDGGPFITLPQVYTEDVTRPGIMNANLGMYRIQMAGNEYVADQEIGLHYQIHRGIGVHQAK